MWCWCLILTDYDCGCFLAFLTCLIHPQTSTIVTPFLLWIFPNVILNIAFPKILIFTYNIHIYKNILLATGGKQGLSCCEQENINLEKTTKYHLWQGHGEFPEDSATLKSPGVHQWALDQQWDQTKSSDLVWPSWKKHTQGTERIKKNGHYYTRLDLLFSKYKVTY